MSTNQEYVLTDTDLIVSKTDLNGNITYINDDFIRIGEFSKQELIGAPHNILRHSDMPKAAFSDMWKTLKSGQPWTGIVKNRTKSGGFYWVRANIMPLLEHEKVIGYMSVRRKPAAGEVTMIESLYRDIQSGKSNVMLDGGNIISPSVVKKVGRTFNNITVKSKLVTLVLVSLLSFLGISSYGIYGLKVVQSATETNMATIDEHSRAIALVRGVQVDFKTQVQEFKNILLRGSNPEALSKYRNGFETEEAKVLENIDALNQIMAPMPEKEFVDMAAALKPAHIEISGKYRTAIKTYNPENVQLIDSLVKGVDRDFVTNINKLVAFHQEEIAKHIEEGKAFSNSVLHQFIWNSIFLGIAITLILLSWSVATSLSILMPIKNATRLINQVAEGDMIETNEFSKNELGKMMLAIKMMGIKFGFEAAEDRRIANEMTRIKMALDEVQMPVTLSNAQRELIYMNNAAQILWGGMREQLVNRFPHFAVQNMYGSSMAQYLETEEDRQKIGRQSKTPVVFLTNIGNKTLRATVISVFDDRDLFVGRATQWQDITAEITAQKQIARIVEESTTGNFRNRINIEAKDGFFRELADGLNTLLGTCEQNYGDISEMFTRLSHGDLTFSITNNYIGEFDTIKQNANHTVTQLTEIIEQIKDITSSLNGSSEEVANSSNHLSKRTTSQASALEETAASMHELNATVEANCENANHANDFVQGASGRATKGVEVIRRVVDTMSEIHESSRKVVDIISVIDGISFQTNILALNAAVEAARAGEQGRGFAVVASEVRSLAQRAAAAAGEIKMLINDSVEKIEDGSSQVVDAGHTMEDIVGSIQTVTHMIGEINAASIEQKVGISQANEAVVNMEEMTQQNAALVEQSAVTANNLKEQAVALSEAVNYFKLR
ncbi:MAG: methyl-accepting chemotaxis protein [Methylococcaceae bacterium]